MQETATVGFLLSVHVSAMKAWILQRSGLGKRIQNGVNLRPEPSQRKHPWQQRGLRDHLELARLQHPYSTIPLHGSEQWPGLHGLVLQVF